MARSIEVLSSLAKVSPSYIPSNSRTGLFHAGRNETISFQIAIRSDIKEEVIKSVSVIWPKAMIYVEGFLDIKIPSSIEGSIGLNPDILIPDIDKYFGEKRNAFPLALEGRTRTLWIDIHIPIDMKVGIYPLKIIIDFDEINLFINVLNYALIWPKMKTAYAVSYNKVALGHGLDESKGPELLKLYTHALLNHGITNSEIAVYAPTDFIDFDTPLQPFLDRITAIRIKDYGFRPTQIEFNKSVAYYNSFMKHAKAIGYYDKLFHYTMDEPKTKAQWDEIVLISKALREAGMLGKCAVTTSIQNAKAAGVDQWIDLYIPTIRFMDNKPTGQAVGSLEPPGGKDTIGNQRSKYLNEVWWYQACGSHGCGIIGGGKEDPGKYHTRWPSYMVDLPFSYSRVMPWMTFKYNIQGQLYYDVINAYGKMDPWNTIFDFGGNGDGTLFYPGTPSRIGGTKHIPIESIRLKQERDGQQDYALFMLASSLGLESQVRALINTVVTNTYTWIWTADVILRTRAAIQGMVHLATTSIKPSSSINVSVKIEIEGKSYTIAGEAEEQV